MTDNKKIAFDPGFGSLVTSFSENMEYAYHEIGSKKSLHQKAFKFKMLKPQIVDLFENSIAFYLGCLLWASYIHFKHQESPLEIEGNGFLGLTQEELDKMDFEIELDYISNFFEKYEKDTQYFLRKKESLKASYKLIVESYREFLKLNDNFMSTKTTADIKLPEHMMFIKELKLDDVEEKINVAIKNRNLSSLFELNQLQ